MNKVFSDYFQLNWFDFTKGMIVSVLSSVVTAVYNIVQAGSFPARNDWREIAIAGLSALMAYLIKNLFSNSEGEVAKVETKAKPKKKA